MAAFAGPAKPFLSLNPQEDAKFQKEVAQVRLRARQQQKQKQKKLTPGVIYVGHIPPALYETQIRAYFSQFGTVTRFRLSRSKRTGNSKGYGFVEFESEDVAKIVGETMNNYLFGERLLKCHFIPPEKVHEELFREWHMPFKKPSYPAVKRYNQNRTLLQKLQMEERFKKKEKLLRKRLAKKGIDYDFPSLIIHKKGKNASNTNLQKSTNSQVFSKKKNQKKASGPLKIPEKTVDSQVLPKKKKKKVSGAQKSPEKPVDSKVFSKKKNQKEASGSLKTPEKTVDSQVNKKKKKKKVSGPEKSPENPVDSQGPTPVCTPTFLEKRKSEAAVMDDDDKDNEIVFKQPTAGVKEIQETQMHKRSWRKRRRKNSQCF
ncbi:MKI67 FHA domain-interacting nucleolar phosphoprotein isoform X2 [Manis pentadactyla]|uniref:MKI67 FHA domain-interacting nucleolar phosphoprotein isoform X2 n=1 Tax=Manis pentadactyla TaxID=143292 RepID=UPI00255C94D1|nr:MKI67 FHA domain-interacting nucleolar phosphoprotein isoform X2 [Manis pentadactyla]